MLQSKVMRESREVGKTGATDDIDFIVSREAYEDIKGLLDFLAD